MKQRMPKIVRIKQINGIEITNMREHHNGKRGEKDQFKETIVKEAIGRAVARLLAWLVVIPKHEATHHVAVSQR